MESPGAPGGATPEPAAPEGGTAGQSSVGQGPPAGQGPPPGWGQPPPGYGPAPGWGQPPPGYGPAPGWGQPPTGYGPAPGWGQPPPGYGPAPGWGQPPPGYGPPPGWGPPPPGYGPPPGWGQPPTAVPPGGAAAYPPGWGPSGHFGSLPSSARDQAGFGRFRPQSFGELLDAAFSLYRSNLRLIVVIAAIVEVPYALITLLIHATLFRALGLNQLFSTATSGQVVDPTQFGRDVGLGRALALAGATLGLGLLQQFVVRPLGTAATARAVSDLYLERPTSVGAAYRAALRHAVTLVGVAALLIGLILVPTAVTAILVFAVSPLFLLLAIPLFLALSLFATVYFALSSQIVMLEDRRALATLKRSRQLIAGSFRRVFGFLFVLGLLSAIIGGILGALVGLAGGFFGPDNRQLFSDAAQALVAVIVAPLTYIALTLLYYDLRIRREAFDVEMLAQAL